MPPLTSLAARCLMLVAAIILNAIATVMYICAGFGPGPRDGLMTGIHRRTGISLRLIRTVIEVTVLLTGWLAGGTVGPGTLIYALTIGPLIQFFLPLVPQRPQRTDTTETCHRKVCLSCHTPFRKCR
ncbi:Uncharacterized BCR, YitT family COG1284 [Tatumella ptyseos]|uniref:Uncharacterized BCR, YitT family COG1284 n=1 Tax=Tatumella ptyseos TaxID=82987 RepID=A0A2X5NVJ7_9GAMM|nr:Uncharacterized BCR, YitT family COG1284 [Tatumella ptyseos]